MLQYIRDRSKGVFVWLIIGLIIAAFALVGVSSYLSEDGNSYVASVNDIQITLGDYQVAYRQERAYRQRLFGDNISPALLNETVLKRVALDRLIAVELVTQASYEAGFRVADGQLGEQIRNIKDFQNDGQFDQALYGRLLNSQGRSQEEFEYSLRREILSRQLIQGLVDSALLTANETDQILRLRKQQRRFAYMVLEAVDLVDDISIDDEAIQQYYAEHTSDFISDEQVSINYLELTPESLDVQIVADEQMLQQMYEDQIADFRAGEERRASHILIKAEDESDTAREDARLRAQDLLQQLRQGADFASLAEAHSADTGSARQGGDLGYFSRGMMVAAFEDKAFTMAEGAISEPIQTPYGYHIIKLTGINTGETKSFAQARDELVIRYRQEKVEEQFFELVDLLTDLTFENPESLKGTAKDLGLTVKTSALFFRHFGAGITTDERVRAAAFSSDVLEAGNNSEVLTLEDDHVLVLRINKHRPSAPRPLNEVRAMIVTTLQQQQASEQLRQAGETIIVALKEGANAAELARAQGAEWNNSGFIDRFDRGIDKDILQQIFRLNRPETDKPTTAAAALANGDYLVATIYAVRDGNPLEVSSKQRQLVADGRQRSLGQHIGAKVMDNLKARADVVEFLDQNN